MSDNRRDKELKQRLNFYREEEHENKGQKETQEKGGATSNPRGIWSLAFRGQSTYTSRTPLSNACDFHIFQEKDQVSPGQGSDDYSATLSHRPEAPAPPDKGKPPLCENLFTPKGQASQPMLSSTGKLPPEALSI